MEGLSASIGRMNAIRLSKTMAGSQDADALRREQRLDRLTRVDRDDSRRVQDGGAAGQAANAVRRRSAGPAASKAWAVGDRLLHSSFGEGHVTHLFGSGEKISIAVKFEGMGPKILDPRLAPILARLDLQVEALRLAALQRTGMEPNVDLALAVLTQARGLHHDAGEAIFLVGRLAGFAAGEVQIFVDHMLHLVQVAAHGGLTLERRGQGQL